MNDQVILDLVKTAGILAFLWWRMNRLEDALSKVRHTVNNLANRVIAVETELKLTKEST